MRFRPGRMLGLSTGWKIGLIALGGGGTDLLVALRFEFRTRSRAVDPNGLHACYH